MKLSIYDLERRIEGTDMADRIFIEDALGGTFTIPDGELEPDHLYSVQITTDILYASGTNPSGSSRAGAIRSRSRAFFDFSTGPLPDVLPDDAPLFLPSVEVGGPQPIFNFDNAVLADAIAFYDPLVAVGYDFAIGEGDPLFGSVLLPDVGDGLFEVLVPDGEGFAALATIAAGEAFDLGGVAAFRVAEIEAEAGLDPEDATAFVTGLSFVADGQFTGTMTPITAEVAPIPLPAEGPLMAAALGALAAARDAEAPASPAPRRTRSAAVVHLELDRVRAMLEGVDLLPLERHVALDLV